MPFKGTAPKASRPATLEELYKELPRMRGAVPGLWLHQGDVLRAYLAEHQNTPDLALELPTGTGKTLVGLVVAEWVRREGAGPVAYACPTNQLARQVLATAKREGVPAVLLVGSARDWPTTDEAAYDSGRAVAVTNYNTVFNSSPKLDDPRMILFDDAHAGEQFVGEQYAVDIKRHRNPDAYKQILAALSPLVSGLLLQRLEDDSPDPGAHHQVRLLCPSLNPGVLAELDKALSRLPPPLSYQVAMIRNGLEACMVYLSYGAVQIRPVVPPTFENAPFARAKQRLYLSATLGGGGELERAFGRPSITRLPLPDGAQPRSGRRFFVFPELAAGDNPDGLVRKLVTLTGKAIVLTQDTVDAATQTAAALAPEGVPVLGKADVEHGLGVFAKSPVGVLGLANRYDGLDLPHDDACRIVVLDGLPNAQSLQEKWLGERADAGAALAERIRTRVVQGAGRCTRGPDDFAVVIVRGSDLTRYLNRPDVRAALDPELQAEVEFGWENSAGQRHNDIVDLVEVFLDHEEQWRTGGEPLVAQARRDAHQIPPPGSEGLQASAAAEVRAWELAYQGDFADASARMQDAAREAGKGGDAARGYRAVLLYLSAVWLSRGADGAAAHAKARQLLRDAATATLRGQWLRETTPLPEQEREELPAVDQVGIAAVAAALGGRLNPTKAAAASDQMVDDLRQTDSGPYERGLSALGQLLGADASKPKGTGRCDSAWAWGSALWTTVEAKSEQDGRKTLPLHDIRQANTQLDQLAHDRGVDRLPPGSPAVIVSARLTVAPNDAAAATPNLYLTDPQSVLTLALDAQSAWDRLISTAAGQPADRLREHVADTLRQFGCLPNQAVERLTQSPIRPATG